MQSIGNQEGLEVSFNNSCKLKGKQILAEEVGHRKLYRVENQKNGHTRNNDQDSSRECPKAINKIYGEKQKIYNRPVRKGYSSYTQDEIKSSDIYKELLRKCNQVKQQQAIQKQNIMKSIKEKSEGLKKAKIQRQRLLKQKERLRKVFRDLKKKLHQLKQRNQGLREDLAQKHNIINVQQYFQNYLLAMRYQNQLMQYDINPDEMTYEEILQLQQKIGNVSKGFTEQQIKKIHKEVHQGPDHLCSICYEDIKKGETKTKFQCQHIFHFCCIESWLQKQKICPMCKQEIIIKLP